VRGLIDRDVARKLIAYMPAACTVQEWENQGIHIGRRWAAREFPVWCLGFFLVTSFSCSGRCSLCVELGAQVAVDGMLA